VGYSPGRKELPEGLGFGRGEIWGLFGRNLTNYFWKKAEEGN